MIKLLIADDHKILVEGLLEIFSKDDDIQVVATAKTGKEVLKKVKEATFDVIPLDLFMTEMDGIECARKLLYELPNQKIIALTMNDEESVITKVMKMNLKGYVLKTADKKELINAIKEVNNGKEYFSPHIKEVLELKSRAPVRNLIYQGISNQLTDREVEIIHYIAEGLSSQEIGKRLFISPRTIETHRSNIIKKLNVNNVASLISYAYKHNILN